MLILVQITTESSTRLIVFHIDCQFVVLVPQIDVKGPSFDVQNSLTGHSFVVAEIVIDSSDPCSMGYVKLRYLTLQLDHRV